MKHACFALLLLSVPVAAQAQYVDSNEPPVHAFTAEEIETVDDSPTTSEKEVLEMLLLLLSPRRILDDPLSSTMFTSARLYAPPAPIPPSTAPQEKSCT